MGVDATPIFLYGTEDIRLCSKLPQDLYLYYENEENEITDESAEGFVGKNICKDFVGFTYYKNSFNDRFEGFGIMLNPSDKVTQEQAEKRVNKVFKKYNLGKAEFCHFVHCW